MPIQRKTPVDPNISAAILEIKEIIKDSLALCGRNHTPFVQDAKLRLQELRNSLQEAEKNLAEDLLPPTLDCVDNMKKAAASLLAVLPAPNRALDSEERTRAAGLWMKGRLLSLRLESLEKKINELYQHYLSQASRAIR